MKKSGLFLTALFIGMSVVFHHDDGSEDVAMTRHTMNDDQIAWFRAGSALNLLRAGG